MATGRPAPPAAGGCTTPSRRWTPTCAPAARGCCCAAGRWTSPSLRCRRRRGRVRSSSAGGWSRPRARPSSACARRWPAAPNCGVSPATACIRPTVCARRAGDRTASSRRSGRRWPRCPRPRASRQRRTCCPCPRAGRPRSRSTNSLLSPASTGPPAFARPGRRGRPARRRRWRASSRTPPRTTPTAARCPGVRGSRGSRPTCTSARSRPRGSGRRWAACGRPRRRRRGGASSPGATSRAICSCTSPARAPNRSTRASSASPGATTPPPSPPGNAARPAIPWWTPACASSGPRAGCMAASAW